MDEQLKREILAQMQLQSQGSVMSKDRSPRPFQGSPIIDPLLQTIQQMLSVAGPTPGDAFQKAPAAAAGVGGLLAALIGDGSSSGQDAGIYRQIGMQRAGGLLNPAEYLMQLQSQPNYQRYLQLVQNMVRRGLGESFPVARGKGQTDPLMQALQQGKTGEQLPATAITYSPTSDIAERFAQSTAEKTRKPAYVAKGTASPQDVAALVPRRQAYSHEQELILKPTETFQPQLAAKYIPPSGQFPWVERKELPRLPTGVDPVTESIMKALAEAAQPPS